MLTQFKWYKKSDGAVATAMDVDLVGDWIKATPGIWMSVQPIWETGAAGTFGWQGTNVAVSTMKVIPGTPIGVDIAAKADDYPVQVVAGAQPTGSTAGSSTILVQAGNEYMRPTYTAISGTAAVPTGNASTMGT